MSPSPEHLDRAPSDRPFRFGAFLAEVTSRSALEDDARRLEAAGFTDLLVADHYGEGLLDPFLTLGICADATSRHLRVGTMVACNDFRHPAMLAKQAATLDAMTGGRFVLGVGAGWAADEFAQLGLTLDPAHLRVARLDEALGIVDELLHGDGPVAHTGTYYRVERLGGPHSVQRPLPILVGGGAPGVLRVAGRRAQVVSLMARSVDGRIDAADITWPAFVKKIEWVRESAGERFGDITLSGLVQDIVLTSDRERAAAAYIERAAAGVFPLTMSGPVSIDDVLTSPLVLIGTPAEVAAHLHHVRSTLGITYFCGLPGMDESLAQVIAALVPTR